MSLTIQISQQFARIGLNITKPQMTLQQQTADLTIQSHDSQMTIDQGLGVLTINGEDAHGALGHKSTTDMISNISSQARRMMLQTIASIVEDGHFLGDLAHGGTIADLARKHVFEHRQPIQDVGPFGSDPLQISYQPQPTTIDWSTPQVDISATVHPAQINYTPGNVSVYMAKQNGLHIDVKGQYLNMTF